MDSFWWGILISALISIAVAAVAYFLARRHAQKEGQQLKKFMRASILAHEHTAQGSNFRINRGADGLPDGSVEVKKNVGASAAISVEPGDEAEDTGKEA